jgi:hypothetical protein
VAKAAKFMKAGGYVGIGLAAGAATMRINEVCRTGSAEDCRQVQFSEGGKLSGNVIGGVTAGVVTGKVTLKYCAGIALKTRGLGGIVCALILSGGTASVGGNIGAKLGEASGELIHEATTP